jgi:hypothetical protein
VGAGVVTANNRQNSFATVASASGLGGLTLFNGGSLSVGAVTVSGVTSRGLSSSGLLRIYTYSGDIAISEDIVTSSTANATTAPALIISAGTIYPTYYNYGGQVVISGSPNVTVGTGGRAYIYSGNPNLSTGLNTLINAKTSNATFNPYHTQYSVTYESNTAAYWTPSTKDYNTIYRSNSSITPLYAYLYSGQSVVYGTTPTYTFATTKGSTAGVLYYGLFTQSSGGTTGVSDGNAGNPTFGTLSFRNQVSATSAAGSYQLTYNGGITPSNTNYVLAASNPAVTVSVNKAPLGIAVTGTYSGSTTVGPVTVTATGLKNSETLTGFSSITLNSKNFADNGTNFVVSQTGPIGTASLSNYSITNSARTAGAVTTANSVTLSKANLTVTATSPASSEYSGSAVTSSVTRNICLGRNSNRNRSRLGD